MVVEKEDLGLSLSLRSFPSEINRSSSALQLNLMPSSSSSAVASSTPFNYLHKASWIHNFPPPLDLAPVQTDRRSEYGAETRSFLRGIDVNQTAAEAAASDEEEEEEAGVSSPNSTISSVSGKRSERDQDQGANGSDENDNSRGMSDEEDGDGCRKKLRLSKDQSAVLEDSFKEHSTLNPKQKLALAKRLGLRPRQVEVWFQNRRARTKLKQTEVDCEFLKRCCENLTEENRRLQKEVQELRALKMSPQFYMQMAPPTTLTMCPSCERVGPPSSAPATHVDRSRFHQVATATAAHHRAIPFNPWATAGATPIPRRPFDALHPRS